MNEQDAYRRFEARLGISAELVPFLAELHMDMTIINPLTPATIKKLGPLMDLRPGKRILDLACGKAGVSLPLVHIYKVHLTGVEMMPEFIREAWSRAEYTGLYENCDFIMDDAAEFVAGTRQTWDAALVIGALPFLWENYSAGLAELRRVVKPGGHIVIGLPYQLADGPVLEHSPQPLREQVTESLAGAGTLIEILDDGRIGWTPYVKAVQEARKRISEEHAGNQVLMDFLDGWVKHNEQEAQALGFALWVYQV